jgi:hypothetical protein
MPYIQINGERYEQESDDRLDEFKAALNETIEKGGAYWAMMIPERSPGHEQVLVTPVSQVILGYDRERT